MIDERQEEQAALYVLGSLPPEETRIFEAALRQNAELRALVAALQAATQGLAGNVPHVAPPAALRQRILEQIEEREKIVSLDRRESGRARNAWVPWALAASFALLCSVLLPHEISLRNRIQEQDQNERRLRGRVDSMDRRVAELTRLADTLSHATNDLQQAVARLQQSNELANLRVAMLGSLLADAPKAVAVTLWDEEKQSGVFVVQNLKPLPKDKDYQLWVIDPDYKAPVDAGVFQVDAQGNVRLQFKAKLPIKGSNKFAVTQEPKGGSVLPHTDQMVLLGG